MRYEKYIYWRPSRKEALPSTNGYHEGGVSDLVAETVISV